MSKAIRFHKTGGPEVLQLDEVSVGEPGPGQARVRHTAIGVNFLDTYQRSGLYPIQLPSGAGNEGAGVVEAVGPGVTLVKAGDRVAVRETFDAEETHTPEQQRAGWQAILDRFARHVEGRGRPSERQPGDHLVALFPGDAQGPVPLLLRLREPRVGEPGGDRVDIDTMRRQLVGQEFRSDLRRDSFECLKVELHLSSP